MCDKPLPLGLQVTRALGLALEGDAAAALERWLDAVADWNRRIDLTAARDERELADLLVADAAMLASRIPRDATLVDVGTGAGAPGLGLAALRPDLAVTLVEPMQKRCAFLRVVIGGWRAAGIARDVRVEQARGGQVATRGGRAFGVAVSRATLAPPEWLELGGALAESVWVLLARGEPPEVDGFSAIDDVRYRWPLTGAERRAVLFRRNRR